MKICSDPYFLDLARRISEASEFDLPFLKSEINNYENGLKTTVLSRKTRRNRRVSLMTKACDRLYHNNSLNKQLELPFGSGAYINSLFIYMPTDTHQVNQQGNLLSHGYCYCKGGCE